MKSGIFFSMAAAVLFCSLCGRAEDGVRLLGPGVGGACYALAIDPANPQTIIGGLDMGFAFRTADGGRSWQVLGGDGINPGYRGCFQAAFAPDNPSVAWIVSEHGAYRSEDNGKTFRRMTRAIGGTPGHWQGIAFDPDDSRTVYLYQGSKARQRPGTWSTGRIFRTCDDGESWEELPSPTRNQPSTGFKGIVIDPASPLRQRQLLAVADDALYLSRDDGKSWTDVTKNLSLPPGAVFGSVDLARLPGNRSRLLLTVTPWKGTDGKIYGGLFCSMDFGKTFRQSGEGLPLLPASRNALIVRSCRAKPERCYLGMLHPAAIFRSDDGGESWRQVTSPGSRTQKFVNPDGSYRFFNLNTGKGNYLHSFLWKIDSLIELAVAASDPDTVIYSDNCGYTMSCDGGKTWRDITFNYGEPFQPELFGKINPVRFTHRISNRNIHLLCCTVMQRDPFEPDTLYGGYLDHGIMISRDNGKSWESPIRGLKTLDDVGWGWCHSITVDPQVRGRLYATFGRDRMYRSDDSGRSWQEIGPPQAIGPRKKKRVCSGIVIDFSTPPGNRTLYATADNGLYKSVDGGKHWQRKVRGLGENPAINQLVSANGILLAGSGIEQVGDKPVRNHGLYRSVDGAESWQAVDEFAGRPVTDIAVCEGHPEHIYVVSQEKRGFWSNGVIHHSADGGITWRKIASGKLYRRIAVNPRNPARLYTASSSIDLNRQTPAWITSSDGGRSWREIAPEQVKGGFVYNILIDSRDPQLIRFHEPFAVCEVHDPEAEK